MLDPLLVDVPCPMCGADPLELCTRGDGAEMESTVHAPRRIRAGLGAPEPETITKERPEGKCRSGKHDWTEQNTFVDAGNRKCGVCRLERQRRRNGTRATTSGRPRNTHCHRGHEFTTENTYTSPAGDRRCRACKTIQSRADNKRRKAKQKAGSK